jgi:hypothetical protein
MNKEDFAGKTIGEIITPKTVNNSYYTPEEFEKVKGKPLGHISLEKAGSFTVVHDDYNVICFKDDVPVTFFRVYEVHIVNINEKRGLVSVTGHETNHEYWYDNGEYSYYHTR